ncbi:MAG TPA: DUF87 domain-containing protein, partial [Vicinamibacteria bacterium]|nr:DUF87 domain-containing protein [Vicinamibacteria bacterium]
MQFEKLGAFYLGKVYDPRRSETRADLLLYDSKDLTTHGLIVGMTGSGKTGLSTVLLEEALLDGVPALVIDPKGDMANLLLRFTDLSPESFAAWIDPSEASRRGVTPEELARDEAARWERGLSAWGQSKERLGMLERAGSVQIFTPGSASGRPLALLRSFECPSEDARSNPDAIGKRVETTVSALLGLAGIEGDPMTSREHILLSNLVEHAWSKGETTSLEELVRASVDPPFGRLGAMDLETFFPAKERLSLATRLNSLLASTAFASWLQGEPLDVSRLLRDDDGRPCLSVLYIAHLSDAERMFFVTLFLEEVIGWMRGQEGTGSLRAILYMDEVFGFFPPVAAPPSKAPMLTLLKQARAFGLGVVLATQNPVDLDYKGLSNIGTWFLGRLQTARDR